MSRQTGLGAPVLSLVAAFALVLALGALFTTRTTAAEPDPKRPQPTTPAADPPRSKGVRITVDADQLQNGTSRPFPGSDIRLTAADGDNPDGSGVGRQVCVTAPAKWTVTGPKWTPKDGADRVWCQWLPVKAGEKTGTVEIAMEES